MKSIKEKQLLVKWAKAMGESVDSILLDEVERYEQLQKSVSDSIRNNYISDLAEASKAVEQTEGGGTDTSILSVLNEDLVIVNEETAEIEAPQVSISRPLVELAVEQISKDIRFEERDNSFQQPNPALIDKNFNDITRKLKFLEQAMGKIVAHGPGSGSYWLRDLGDTNYTSVKNAADDSVLSYNSASSKWEATTDPLSLLFNGSFLSDNYTTLTSSLSASSASPVSVTSTSGFSTSGHLHIDTEIIGYTGKTSTTFTGITRGISGSSASTHAIGDGVGSAQGNLGAGVISNVNINSTAFSNGVTLDNNTGIVTIANAGRYNLMFSVQTECYGNAPDDSIIWFMKNGVIIERSASYSTVQQIHGGKPGSAIITVNIFVDCLAGDTVNLQWTSVGGTTAITTIPPINSNVPASPGVIFTVNRVFK